MYHLDRSGALAPPWRTKSERIRHRLRGRTTRGGAHGCNAAK